MIQSQIEKYRREINMLEEQKRQVDSQNSSQSYDLVNSKSNNSCIQSSIISSDLNQSSAQQSEQDSPEMENEERKALLEALMH